jgi:hypothetical protein
LTKKLNGVKRDDSSDLDISEDNSPKLDENKLVDRKSTVDYDIDVKLKDGEAPNLILYKYRWVVLAAYFMSSAATGSLQGSLSTNREIYVQAYKDDGLTRYWL